MSANRDEMSRKLAEFIGWKNVKGPCRFGNIHGDPPVGATKVRFCSHPSETGENTGSGQIAPDFFTSEEASALLIDKLLATLSCRQILLDAETCFSDQPSELNECEQDHEACIFAHLHIYIHGTDRKTAIALAALKLIDSADERDTQ